MQYKWKQETITLRKRPNETDYNVLHSGVFHDAASLTLHPFRSKLRGGLHFILQEMCKKKSLMLHVSQFSKIPQLANKEERV